jgi:hypothetical protein
MPTRRLSAKAIESRSLQRRLKQLETRHALKVNPPEAMAVIFTEPDGSGGRRECDRAEESGGPGVWYRQPGESEQDFQERVMDDVPKGCGPCVPLVFFIPADHRSPGQRNAG